jgi:hypothetical protein
MVTYYMDEHIPRPITKGLRECRVDVLTVQEDGRDGGSDVAALDRATELGRVLFTIDVDFYAIVAQRQKDGIQTAGVFKGSRHLSYRACIDDLELAARCSEPHEWMNKITHLPL